MSALEFIHSRGLVYRDVKPENVLLFDPECRRIKLTDFGLTRPKGTKLKLVAGVIPYTAPELSNTTDAQGVPIDASMDAWAFGVLLFCLLTGYFPWEQSLPNDPFFEDFMLWQETGLEENLPRHWKRLTQSNRQDCDDDVSPRSSWEVSPPSQDQQGSWPCIHMDIIQLKTSTPTTQHRQGMKPWA